MAVAVEVAVGVEVDVGVDVGVGVPDPVVTTAGKTGILVAPVARSIVTGACVVMSGCR